MNKRIVRTATLTFVSTIALPAITTAQLPSRFYTPGSAARVDVKRLCSPDFTASVKPMSKWQKEEALTRYGLRPDGFDGTLDHLIPVSLGGSNDPDNLFPFHDSAEFTLAAKSQLGDRLRVLVCEGKISLKEAQDAFKKDWTKAYRQYVQALNAPGE